MANYDYSVSIADLNESESFIKKRCNINDIDSFLNELLQGWLHEWNEFDVIVSDIHEKVEIAHKVLFQKCKRKKYSDILQISIECIVLNHLHDHIFPLLSYICTEDDKSFYDKCKKLCDINITAEQLGAPEDYAIPLSAAIVEIADLDTRKSAVEKIRCLCTTYDLIFAELKSAMIEVISKCSDENEIPIIENKDIIPILMIVLIKSKLIHFSTNISFIEKFSWKLQESRHVQNILTMFKDAAARIVSLEEATLRPSSGVVCKDLDLNKVTCIMADIESPKYETKSLLNNYIKRVTDLIYTSTTQVYSLYLK